MNSAMPLEDLNAYAVILPPVFTPVTRMTRPKLRDLILIPMRLKRIRISNDKRSEAQKCDGQSDLDQHTPAQKSKRQRFCLVSHSEDGVGPFDLESIVTVRGDSPASF
jgi:hypothetical protein